MDRIELLNKVRNCTPQLGWENKFPNLYGKYGMTICGIRDGWHWFEEDNITEYSRQKGQLPLTDASDIELFEMWALADNYWLNKYEGWLKRSEEKSSKLESFAGKCEGESYCRDIKRSQIPKDENKKVINNEAMSRTMGRFKELIEAINTLREKEKLMIESFEKSTCELSTIFHRIIECELSGRHSCVFDIYTCPTLYAEKLENIGFEVHENRNYFDLLCGYKIYWE